MTYSAIPHLPMHCSMCAARWRAHVARRYETKEHAHGHERTQVDRNEWRRKRSKTPHGGGLRFKHDRGVPWVF